MFCNFVNDLPGCATIRTVPLKLGDAAVDGHSAPSTLGGETANMVDKFRQLKLKEYNDIIKLCRLSNVPLTEDLLKKGL